MDCYKIGCLIWNKCLEPLEFEHLRNFCKKSPHSCIRTGIENSLNQLDSTSYALRGQAFCARFLSRSTEGLDLRIVKVSNAIFPSNLGLKLAFLSCSVAIVCRFGNDVSPCIHHPFIISFDLCNRNDERKPFEDSIATG